MHPLDGARAKWVRACEHLDALDAETTSFVRTHAYRIVSEYDAQARQTTFCFAQEAEVPLLRWGVIVGDVLHGFNSALDHIAWQFALLYRKKPSKKTSWPVCTKDGDWESKTVQSMLAHIQEPHRTFIKDHQPYPAPNDQRPETHAFAMLRKLANIDKHRVLHTAVLLPLDVDVEYAGRDIPYMATSEVFFGEPLQEGTKLAVVEWRGDAPDEPQAKINANLSLYIGLVGAEYGWMDQGSVFYILRAIRNEVDKTLIRAHATF